MYKLLILFAVCLLVSGRPRRKVNVEILSTGENSVRARFQPFGRVRKYFVSIGIHLLQDVGAHATINLGRKDLGKDGYYYIEVDDLAPGETYNIWIASLPKYKTAANKQFFIGCDRFTFYCAHENGRQMCLDPNELCNGIQMCGDGSDEERFENGTCMHTLPTLPPPPPPPVDAPCILEKEAAISSKSMNYKDCYQDGSYSAMTCRNEETFNCYCIDKITGDVLKVMKSFHPFVNWNFTNECAKLQGETPDQGGWPKSPELEGGSWIGPETGSLGGPEMLMPPLPPQDR